MTKGGAPMRHTYLFLLLGLAAALVFLPQQAFASAIVNTICDAYTLIGTQAGKAIMTLAVMGVGFMALAAGKLNLPMCLVIAIGGVLLLSPCQFVTVITGTASPCACRGITGTGGGGGGGGGPPPLPGNGMTPPITGCPVGMPCTGPVNGVTNSPFIPTP